VVDYLGLALEGSCTVSVYDRDRNYVKSCSTGANGIYMVQGLPQGSFKLYAIEEGFYSRVGDQPAGEWYGGASLFSGAQEVKVKVQQATANIDFSLDKGGYIGGRVTPPGNQALQWGSVTAYNQDGDWVRDEPITQDGRYFIQGLASGEYRIRATANVYGRYLNQWYAKATCFEAATAVSVTAPNAVLGIDIPLESRGYLKGYVLDAKKKRLVDEGSVVYLIAYDAMNGDYAGYDLNSFVGGYSLKLFSGRYKVGAVSVYADWMEERNRQAAGYYRKGTSFYDPQSQSVSLSTGATKKLKSLALKNVKGAISGNVFEKSSDEPVAGGILIVWVFDENGFLAKVFAESELSGSINGGYVVPGLRPGNYYLLLWYCPTKYFSDDDIWQWYNGMEVDIVMDLFIPKIDIPSGAYAVVVGKEEVKGIDFYVGRTK
jgi:hypothetical protein